MSARERVLAPRDEKRGLNGGEAPALQIGRLHEQHHRMVGALCRLLLRDPVEAEDAVQQTFLSAFASLIAGTVPRQPAPWLATIARRECWARTAQRRRRPLPLEEAGDPAAGTDALEDAIRSADFAALWSAINALPRTQRKAFLMRELSGLSYSEVAVALGVTESAIESLLVRARRQLRDGLATTASTANIALTPLLLLQQRLLRLLGGNPAARTGAATAVGLPAAVKLTATTAGIVAIGSVGAGFKATLFSGHGPSRPSLAVARQDASDPVPDRTDQEHGPASSHVGGTLQTMTRAGRSPSQSDHRTLRRFPLPSTTPGPTKPATKPAGTSASDNTPSWLPRTVAAQDPTEATPSASPSTDATPSETTQTETTQTEASQTDRSPTDTTSSDTATTETNPADTTPTDTMPTDTTSTDTTSTDTPSPDSTPTP
jgi:RNA polymerase sigma-70 factor, ECF subfamily